MGVLGDFALETGTGLLGVFVAVLLALWVDRRRAAAEARDEQRRQQARLADVKDLILMSVVKNASEAKRLAASLGSETDPYLLGIAFETAVWEATQTQFVRLATLDERVQFARFFDHARGVARLLEFHRGVRAQMELNPAGPDAGDRSLMSGIVERLRAAAMDVRLEGITLVTDHGNAVQRRLLGLSTAAPPAS